LIRASLLKGGIEWLNVAYLRTRVGVWRDPSELANRVAQFVEPSKPTRPSRALPFVYEIRCVAGCPKATCVSNGVGFLAT
jgi:hypothetical protein